MIVIVFPLPMSLTAMTPPASTVGVPEEEKSTTKSGEIDTLNGPEKGVPLSALVEKVMLPPIDSLSGVRVVSLRTREEVKFIDVMVVVWFEKVIVHPFDPTFSVIERVAVPFPLHFELALTVMPPLIVAVPPDEVAMENFEKVIVSVY